MAAENELLWEGDLDSEPGTRSFELDRVEIASDTGRLLCLTATETGPDKCYIGTLDGVCESGETQEQVLAGRVLEGPPQQFPPEDEPDPVLPASSSEPSGANSSEATPKRSCRKRNSRKNRIGCDRSHRPHKRFSRGKDIPLP